MNNKSRLFALLWIVTIALFFAPVPQAMAQEAQPGDACALAGSTVNSGGPEIAGLSHLMICDGANWVSVMEYKDDGTVLYQTSNDAGACTAAKDGRMRYNSASSPPWDYCDGGTTSWLPFEQPQCLNDDTGECFLEATRSNDDSDFIATNIKTGVNILGVTGSVSGAGILWSEFSKETASDAAAGDWFGQRVSVDGDAIIVGAPSEGGAGTARGAAYIFERANNGVWSEKQKLTASDTADSDEFGISVAINGDTAVIGAYLEDGAGTDRGAAYVFERASNGTWSEKQKLIASDTANIDWFGFGSSFGNGIAVSGDVIVVGAVGEDGAGTDRGAAYIFERASSGTWSQIQKLTASDTVNNGKFGQSVAVDGEVIVVAGINASAEQAYVFERGAGGTWSEIQKLTASDWLNADTFGNSVSVDGGTIVVSAQYEEPAGGNSRGAVYVYERASNGTWSETQKLTASDAEDLDFFGSEVSVSGDTIVVGARGEDSTGAQNGAAYMFERVNNGVWFEVVKLTASDASAFDDWFGWSVAVEGNTTVVGARTNDAVYVFNEN